MWVSRGLCGYVATLYVGNEINVGSWGSDERGLCDTTLRSSKRFGSSHVGASGGRPCCWNWDIRGGITVVVRHDLGDQ